MLKFFLELHTQRMFRPWEIKSLDFSIFQKINNVFDYISLTLEELRGLKSLKNIYETKKLADSIVLSVSHSYFF